MLEQTIKDIVKEAVLEALAEHKPAKKTTAKKSKKTEPKEEKPITADDVITEVQNKLKSGEYAIDTLFAELQAASAALSKPLTSITDIKDFTTDQLKLFRESMVTRNAKDIQQ